MKSQKPFFTTCFATMLSTYISNAKLAKRFFLGLIFFFISIQIFAPDSFASHFRGGHLTWRAVNSTTVEFTYIAVFELDDNFSNPKVGDQFVDELGDTRLSFGDDTSTLITQYEILAIDFVDNFVKCRAIDPALVHTYPFPNNNGDPWQVMIEGCCRIENLKQTPPIQNFFFHTLVDLSALEKAPNVDSTFSYFVRLVKEGIRTFKIPLIPESVGADTNNVLTARFATLQESGLDTLHFAQMEIAADTLIVKANTTGLSFEDSLWATQIVIEKRDKNNNSLLSLIAIDFLIKIDYPPQFDSSCDLSFDVVVGTTFTHHIQASDPEDIDMVTLELVGSLPSGATIDSLLPVINNPARTTFSWTPIVGDLGEHVVRFRASDRGGADTTCTFVINVISPPIFTTPCDTTYVIKLGDSLQIPVEAFDADTSDVVTLSAIGLPDGVIVTPDLPVSNNPASITLAWLPHQNDVGKHDVTFFAVDREGLKDTCNFSIEVRDTTINCSITFNTPMDSAVFCTDSALVAGTVEIFGGFLPVFEECNINGIPAEIQNNSFAATIPLVPGENRIIAICTVTDDGGLTAICQDTIFVTRKEKQPIALAVSILSPEDSLQTSSDSIIITGLRRISGGTEPLRTICEINGVAAILSSDSLFSAVIPLVIGENLIVAACKVTDACDQEITQSDTIRVFRSLSVSCKIEITSPKNNTFVCADSITVTGFTQISGGLVIDSIKCDVNGFAANTADSVFSVKVPFPNDNLLVARCTIYNSTGVIATCLDTVQVFRDFDPPTCSLELGNGFRKITAFDEGSGIASFEATLLVNTRLVIPDFEPGAKQVAILAEAIDPNERMAFDIKITDLCGNLFVCDPVLLSLSADNSVRQHTFSFPSLDRYFRLTNHGLTEIHVELNGNAFTLFTDASRTGEELNSYHMPLEGNMTIDMLPYLRADEINEITISYEGPAGTSAELVLINIANEIDYVLDLQAIPSEFHLAQNYPNPFNPSTLIRFQLPVSSDVTLSIYNMQGQLVRTLVSGEKAAGVYNVTWDTTDNTGLRAASGVYVFRIQAGARVQARRMVLIK